MDFELALSDLRQKAYEVIKAGVLSGMPLPVDLEENPFYLGTGPQPGEDSYYLTPDSQINPGDCTIMGWSWDGENEYWLDFSEVNAATLMCLANHYQGIHV